MTVFNGRASPSGSDSICAQLREAITIHNKYSLIFQISSSANKPRVIPGKSFIPSSASKLSAINKAREAEESQKMEKEDPRSKKEALLEAKREYQKK